jgi:hypothetical protein
MGILGGAVFHLRCPNPLPLIDLIRLLQNKLP